MGSILDKIKSMAPSVTLTEVQTERLDICNTCEHYVKSSTSCLKCGCFMKLKVKFKNVGCPVGKW